MAQPYPLYDELAREVESRGEKGIDIKKVCSTINSICQNMSEADVREHYKEITALIIHYDIIKNGGVLLSQVPFEGKTMPGSKGSEDAKGLLYNTGTLPHGLIQIIAQYIEKYSVN